MATVASVAFVVPFGPFWHWTFSGDSSVLALGESRNVALRGGLAFELFLLGNVATLWLVARRGWRREDIDLWLWLGTGLVAFVAGWRFFGHYWFQVLPPLCLLAGLGAAACRASVRRMLVVAVAAPAVAAWVLAFSPHPIDPTVRALASYAEKHTDAGDRVTVWGNAPEVYWLSGRAPGGALVNTDFVTGKTAGRTNGPQRLADATPGARDTFLDSLEQHPPELFFDTSTADLRQYGKYPVTLVPPVAQFLRRHYRPVATVRGVRGLPAPFVGVERRARRIRLTAIAGTARDPVVEPVADDEHDDGIQPAEQHVGHVVLAEVHQRHRHRQRIQHQQPAPARRAGPEEEGDEQRGRGVERRHRGDLVHELLRSHDPRQVDTHVPGHVRRDAERREGAGRDGSRATGATPGRARRSPARRTTGRSTS